MGFAYKHYEWLGRDELGQWLGGCFGTFHDYRIIDQ